MYWFELEHPPFELESHRDHGRCLYLSASVDGFSERIVHAYVTGHGIVETKDRSWDIDDDFRKMGLNPYGAEAADIRSEWIEFARQFIF